MTETKYPVFQEGDRVNGMYSVEYDDKIEGGHDCCINIPHGYGWHTHARVLAPYQDEPAESVHSMSYDEVMI